MGTGVNSNWYLRRRPARALEFFRQLLWVGGIDERHIGFVLYTRKELKLFRCADNEPKDLRVGVVEDLAQCLRTNPDSAVFRHRQSLVADAKPAGSFSTK